ncbi:MAG: SIS domain-containing protein [Caulobacteraceae bacterium]
MSSRTPSSTPCRPTSTRSRAGRARRASTSPPSRASRSWPAAPPISPGLTAKYLFERLADLPVDVEIASEFRYRDPAIVPGTLALAISQSGETADTLAALRWGKARGLTTAAIVNAHHSTMAREADVMWPTTRGRDRRRLHQGLHRPDRGPDRARHCRRLPARPDRLRGGRRGWWRCCWRPRA